MSESVNPVITIETFNIRNDRAIDDRRNWWGFRRRSALRAITKAQPQVIALQEVRPLQLRYLKHKLRDYVCIATGRDNGRSRGEHCPIFVHQSLRIVASETRWFSPTPFVAGSKYTDARHHRICTTVHVVVAGQTLTIANLHIDSFNPELRRQSLRLVKNWAAVSNNKWIVVGDFNCAIDAPEMGELLENGWSDALGTFPTSGLGASTFHGFTGSTDGVRIDHILIPSSVHTLKAEIQHQPDSERLPSDHWPVWAQLVLDGSAGARQ